MKSPPVTGLCWVPHQGTVVPGGPTECGFPCLQENVNYPEVRETGPGHDFKRQHEQAGEMSLQRPPRRILPLTQRKLNCP